MALHFRILVIFLFCLSCTSLVSHPPYRTEKKHFKEINKNSHKSHKGKRFVLVQSAQEAQIAQHPTEEGKYQLVLKEIHPYIQFYRTQPSKSYGLIFMKQYVWFCKIGKSAFLKCKRGALGYISYESDPSSKSEPQVIELLQPHYHKKENTLIYDISSVDAFQLGKKKMSKVTLIIDLALN